MPSWRHYGALRLRQAWRDDPDNFEDRATEFSNMTHQRLIPLRVNW
jgi:hypothetical protein